MRFNNMHLIGCTYLFFSVCEVAWWEVDLGEDINVARVTIYNRIDDAGHTLDIL